MARQIFTHANLLDGDHPAVPDATIIVENGRIAAIERGGVARQEADEVWDLGGRTLMPGMVSGHFHGCFHNLGATPGAPAMEHPPAIQAYRALANAQLALRCGFTAVVSAGAPLDIDAQLEYAIENGMHDGPRMVPCSRDTLSSVDSFMPWWLGIEPDRLAIGICDGPDELRRAVRLSAGRGARLFKMSVSGGHGLPGGKETRLFSNTEIRAAVDAAHDVGVRVRAHITGKRYILDCIEAGVDILDHCDGMDEECIDAMVEAGSIVLPSLYQPYRLLNMPAMFGFSDDTIRRDFEQMCEILPKAVAAGVTLCVGDDYGTAVSPHGDYAKEMAVYVEHAGIAPLEVIRWATRNGARLMQREADLGMIEVGRIADLIVVDGDPSRDIGVLDKPGAILAVMRDGRFVTEGRPPARDLGRPRLAPAAE